MGGVGNVAVHVSCACVYVPLRQVLHAYCFRRQWVPFSCVLLGNLVMYVFSCFVCGAGECVLQCWCWYTFFVVESVCRYVGGVFGCGA